MCLGLHVYRRKTKDKGECAYKYVGLKRKLKDSSHHDDDVVKHAGVSIRPQIPHNCMKPSWKESTSLKINWQIKSHSSQFRIPAARSKHHHLKTNHNKPHLQLESSNKNMRVGFTTSICIAVYFCLLCFHFILQRSNDLD